MSDELFDLETVAMDSPRLAWMKRHRFTTWNQAANPSDDKPWNAARRCAEPGMIQGPVCEGSTEDEALTALAANLGLRLWNEEAS